jgi:hypothetical protein
MAVERGAGVSDPILCCGAKKTTILEFLESRLKVLQAYQLKVFA